MRLTVFGASGGVGRELVRQGLSAGHHVRAVVRDPSRAPRASETVQLDLGTCTMKAAAAAVRDTDAVLSALGSATKSDQGIATVGTRRITVGMHAVGLHRLVVVSAAPVADVTLPGRPHASPPADGDDLITRLVLGPIIRRIFRATYADLAAMEDLLRASNLDWTAVRPPRLTDGPRTGCYRSALGRNLPHGRTISRADLADCMLALLAQQEAFDHTVGVAY